MHLAAGQVQAASVGASGASAVGSPVRPRGGMASAPVTPDGKSGASADARRVEELTGKLRAAIRRGKVCSCTRLGATTCRPTSAGASNVWCGSQVP